MRGTWANGWPAVDVEPFEFEDFETVLDRLRAAYGAETQLIRHPFGGGLADFDARGEAVELLMDDWTFSIATPTEALRDEILALLDGLSA